MVRRCWPYTTSRWELGFIRLNAVLICFRLKQTFGILIRIRRKIVVLKKAQLIITYVVSLQRQKSFIGHDTRLFLLLSRASHNFGLVYDSGNRKQTRHGFGSKSWHQFNDNHWKMKVKFRYFNNRLKLDMLEYISYLKSVRRIHL